LWLLGYPDAALADIERALADARAIEQAATSLYTQAWAAFTQIHCGKYPEASAQLDEVTALAEKKGPFWTLPAMIYRGFLHRWRDRAQNRPFPTRARLKYISSARSMSRAHSKQSPWNYAQQ
jgi:hypothetical protein